MDPVIPSSPPAAPAVPLAKGRGKPWLMAALGATLVLAVGLQQLGSRAAAAPAASQPVAKLLPDQLPAWQITDRPMTDTQEEKAAVSELLNYDDAVFRIYSRGGAQFAIYLAHWNPGRMSPRLIAGHTPDVCWPAAGWERRPKMETAAGPNGRNEQDNLTALLALVGLPPGEFRVYDLHGTIQYVVFWHVNGNELVNYGTGSSPPWWAMFADLAKHGLNQRREQWFVRIGSSVPFSILAEDDGFRQTLAQLRGAGLRRTMAP